MADQLWLMTRIREEEEDQPLATTTLLSDCKHALMQLDWLCGTLVEHRSLNGELCVSCARLAADG